MRIYDEKLASELMADDENFLNLVEKGKLQLKADSLIKRMTEIVDDMTTISKDVPGFQEDVVAVILIRAYWIRGFCYVEKDKLQQALDDFVCVDRLNPGNKDVKEAIKHVKSEMKSVGPETFFSNVPEQDNVHTPKARRYQAGEADVGEEEKQPPKYVELGSENSAFYKHEKKHQQHQQSPSHQMRPGHLNQPGGRKGNK